MKKDTLIPHSYSPYDRENHTNARNKYKYELLIKKIPNSMGDSFYSNDYEKIQGLEMGLRIAGLYDCYTLIHHTAYIFHNEKETKELK